MGFSVIVTSQEAMILTLNKRGGHPMGWICDRLDRVGKMTEEKLMTMGEEEDEEDIEEIEDEEDEADK
jgi:hypothetical protein